MFQLRDHDYLKLQFLGTKDGWLSCQDSSCDLRGCSVTKYQYFDGQCYGEEFQIISNSTDYSTIKSGQEIRLRYMHQLKTWMTCSQKSYCGKSSCPGTSSLGSNFNICKADIFRIFAHGKRNGEVIYNGDVVMLYYTYYGKYVSIQGLNYGDDTSLSFCPGLAPPAYLSFGLCSKNVFRIYQKPRSI